MTHTLAIQPIIDGKVELFVKSIYKRKRWFDIYLRIWYGNDPTDDLLSKDNIQRYIHQISIQYNMDKRQIIQSYFDYIIRMRSHILSGEFLNIMEDCLHNYDTDIENLIAFFYYKLHKYYKYINCENA